MNIGQLTATLGVDTSGLWVAEKEMEKFRKNAEEHLTGLSKTLDKTGRNIYYFGTAATKFLTLPLTLAGAASFKMAKDFEASTQKIVGLVGVSQDQVNAWSKELLQLGPALGKGPKELADALYFVTSSGYKGAEAMDIVTNSAKAASAGLGDTKDIADLVTSAMNAYSESGLTAVHTLDVLTAAVREGKGEASDYAKQLGDVIPISSKMGVSFDEVAAAMSAMTLTGTKVSESATYMRQILVSILDPSSESAKALNTIGTAGKELRNSLANQGLLATLMKLNDLTKIYGETVMAKVFPNVRALTGVLSLMGDRLEANKILFEEVSNSSGDMQNAFDKVAKTIDFKWNQAMATSESAMISFTLAIKDSVIPIIEGFSKTIKRLSDWYLSLSESQRTLVANIGLFLAAIGPLAIAVGLTMRAFAGLSVVVKGLIPLFTAFKTIMITNPFGALIAIVGTYAASLLLLGRTTDEVTESQQAYNDEAERTKKIWENSISIEKLMKVAGTLNARQLADLKERITTQIAAEEDLTSTIEAELKQRTKSAMSAEEQKRLLYKVSLQGYVMTEAERAAFSQATNQSVLQNTIDANKKSTASYKDYLTTVEKLLKQRKKKEEIGGIDLEGQQNAFKLSLDKYKIYLDNLKKYGDDLEKVNVPIKEGGRTKYTMQFKFATPEFDTQGFDDYRKALMRTVDVGGPLENLNRQLADLALKSATFGDALDPENMELQALAQQIDYVKNSMQLLWDEGMRPGNDAIKYMGLSMDDYIQKLKELQAMQEQMNFTQKIGNIVANEFASALEGDADSAKDFANAMRAAVKSAIAAIIAQAVIKNVAKAVERSPTWWGAILAGAAAGAATKALFETVIPKFAKGGVVPQGYPNDSYPALLTSGEMVVPAGKLPNLQKSSEMDGNVVFVIRGNDLVGVLDKQNKKNKIL